MRSLLPSASSVVSAVEIRARRLRLPRDINLETGRDRQSFVVQQRPDGITRDVTAQARELRQPGAR